MKEEKEKRVYWLDVQNNNYNYDLLVNNEEEFVTEAEKEGNVATIDYFINTILNEDDLIVDNCIFLLK